MSQLMKMHGIEFQVNGSVRVSSRKVAEKFGKHHRNVVRDIRKLIKKDLLNFEPISYLDKYGREQPEFLMDRDGFAILAMGFTGEKALEWKLDFLKAFNEMESYIVAEEKRREERALSAMKAPEMTDAVKEMKEAEGKQAKPFHYSNEFDMINRIVLGVSSKKWREHMEMDKSESFRDSLSPVQIEAVQNLQSTNTGLILGGIDYQERKKILSRIYNKKFSVRIEQEILKEMA